MTCPVCGGIGKYIAEWDFWRCTRCDHEWPSMEGATHED